MLRSRIASSSGVASVTSTIRATLPVGVAHDDARARRRAAESSTRSAPVRRLCSRHPRERLGAQQRRVAVEDSTSPSKPAERLAAQLHGVAGAALLGLEHELGAAREALPAPPRRRTRPPRGSARRRAPRPRRAMKPSIGRPPISCSTFGAARTSCACPCRRRGSARRVRERPCCSLPSANRGASLASGSRKPGANATSARCRLRKRPIPRGSPARAAPERRTDRSLDFAMAARLRARDGSPRSTSPATPTA